MGNSTKKLERPPRRLAYTWHCSKKCEKLQPFSSVVIKSAAVLCICWRSTVHNAISPAEQNHKCLPRGLVRSISMRGALLFPPTLHAFFAKHSKTRKKKLKTVRFLATLHAFLAKHSKTRRKKKLKTVQFLAEKKIRPQTFKCSWRKLTKNTEPGRLDGVFVRGHVDPSNLYLILTEVFYNEARFWDALSETGGVAHATRMVASEDLVEIFGQAHLLGVCTLLLLTIEDVPSLGIRPMVRVPGRRPNRRMDRIP